MMGGPSLRFSPPQARAFEAPLTMSLYDHPAYYELVFGSDWRAEFHFLKAVFAKHAQGGVRSLFEPACGTGRLLVQFRKSGFAVAGNDLNAKAVDYCNARFARRGWERPAVVGDMADFRLARPVDAAFNLINSFRHLPGQAAAEAHLRCMADAVRPGGVYLLGLHLTPTRGCGEDAEEWSARRGHLQVNSRLWSIDVDRAGRRERVGMTFDVFTPTRRFQIDDEVVFRTYTAEQMQELIASEPRWRLAETYDFHYDVDHAVQIDGETQDVVYVLARREVPHSRAPAAKPARAARALAG